jgi:hypothetical protein
MISDELGRMTFDAEQCEDIERMAATGFSLKEMAMYFDVPLNAFKSDAQNPDSKLIFHLERGKLTVKMNASIALIQLAESGNVTAAQQLAKMQRDKEYQNLLLELEDSDYE